jgi:glyoxylase-like metal-dependent hydrolase (beta-lactamase superfamily II)
MLMLVFLYEFAKIDPCRNVDILNQNIVTNYLGKDAVLLEVKGHTDDSYDIMLECRICLSGDVFVNSLGEFYLPFANYPEELISSWKKLLVLNCASYYPGHGKAANRETLSKNIKRAGLQYFC